MLDKFDALLGDVIDRILGVRCTSTGYQYSEIIRALFSVYFCGGECMEDIRVRQVGQDGRQNVLNIYSKKPYNLIWAYG